MTAKKKKARARANYRAVNIVNLCKILNQSNRRKLYTHFCDNTNSKYRPLIKEMKSWPHPNLDAQPGNGPFDDVKPKRTRSLSASTSPRKMSRRKLTRSSTTRKGQKTSLNALLYYYRCHCQTLKPFFTGIRVHPCLTAHFKERMPISFKMKFLYLSLSKKHPKITFYQYPLF
jgi:hypothetical protein